MSSAPDDLLSTTPLPTATAVNEMVEQLFPGSNNTCDAIGADFAVACREISDSELRPGAFVSGPSQFGLADAALWYLVFGATGRTTIVPTSQPPPPRAPTSFRCDRPR